LGHGRSCCAADFPFHKPAIEHDGIGEHPFSRLTAKQVEGEPLLYVTRRAAVSRVAGSTP
jgi:hypothetical protein